MAESVESDRSPPNQLWKIGRRERRVVTDQHRETREINPSWIETHSSVSIAIGVGVLALAIYLWQLSVPESVSFYDTGVYMAATIHFVSGVLPYRDFTFVNPPGILLLMSPVGIFARIFGSHDGLILARVLTSMVTALNASLLAWLVRHRGRFAMLLAGIGLAILPIVFFVSSDLKLDPYSICFVLLGSLSILSRQRQGDELKNRSLLIGGVLFGIAAVFKLWAFFPFLALITCLLPIVRHRSTLFVGAAALGFIVPSLPFLLFAPGNFINQVFTVQLLQKVNPQFSPGITKRLIDLTGVFPTSIAPTAKEAVVIFVMLFLFVGATLIRVANRNVTDAYLALASALTVFALLTAPTFQMYWAYYAAPFLVGTFAISISSLGDPLKRVRDRVKISGVTRRFLSWSVAGIGVLLVFALVLSVTTFYTNYAWFYGLYGPKVAAVDRVVPAGKCVVYDYVIFGVYTNRITSDDRSCPSVVDPYGMWLDFGDHVIPPPSKFVSEWKGYFRNAQYVVLNNPHTTYVPWNNSLRKWFDAHYHLLYGKDYIFIYANNSQN
jgi:hypothetical protein